MYTSDNDKLFLSQLDDGVYLCQQRQKPYFFPFLSERKQAVAKRYLDSSGFLTYRFYGGYEDSERKVLGLYFYDEIEDFPVTALEITFRKADKLTHRSAQWKSACQYIELYLRDAKRHIVADARQHHL